MKGYYGKYLIIERPNFAVMPKISLSIGRHCYLLPTGCGFSKSMAQHVFNSGYGSENVYKCQHFMITYAYTLFFLWFRLHISMIEKPLGSGLMQNFNPVDKSKSTIDDFIK